ncbi:DNA/RNA helicase domain-containing protein [Roseburia hominis]
MYLFCEEVGKLARMTGEEIVGILKERISSDENLQEIYYKNNCYNESEVNSWKNSIPALLNVLNRNGFGALRAVLEYSLPYIDERMDVVLLGKGPDGNMAVVIVELKQWKEILTEGVCEKTFVRIPEDPENERKHPCMQLNTYETLLKLYHKKVRDNGIKVYSLAYLHNFVNKEQLFCNQYELFKKTYDRQVFVKGAEAELIAYIERFLTRDGIGNKYQEFLEGEFENPKEVFDKIGKLLKGERCITLLKEQPEISAQITKEIKQAEITGNKVIALISGAPGTGKSVLGLFLMSFYYRNNGNNGSGILYSTPNRTLKEVLNFNIWNKDTGISGPGGNSILNTYNLKNGKKRINFLVIDEAQRLQKLDSELEKLIDKTNILIILQDDDQIVRMSEEGTRNHITCCINNYKKRVNSHIVFRDDFYLKTNLRNGSGAEFEKIVNQYLSNEKSTLGLSAGVKGFEVSVKENLSEIEAELSGKSQNFRCKWLAPFCWSWNRNNEESLDIHIPDQNFHHPWNPLRNQAEWYAYREEKNLRQVGCVYTCQGLEFDYVGLIVWDDLYWDHDRWRVDLNKIKDYTFIKEIVEKYGGKLQNDFSVAYGNVRYRDINAFLEERNADFDEIITLVKNTYRILFTRATKGIYIWFRRPEEKEKFLELFQSI